MQRLVIIAVLGFIAAMGIVLLTSSQDLKAQALASVDRRPAVTRTDLVGGPRGLAKTSEGMPVAGLMVQLISPKTSIRTTVYTDESGRYEFPKLETGDYTLRSPRPLEFRRYVKEGVRIDGATQLADLVVQRVSKDEFLPATPDILSQLTGAEVLANMPATTQEKQDFDACGSACHGPDYFYRVKFDEASWRKLVYRMATYSFRVLLAPPSNVSPAMETRNERIVKWLARHRAPDSAEPSAIKPFPRPYGPATRAVVTEYELPWGLANSIHDVAGDAEGNIWFTPNRNPFLGRLDPKTGRITSYRIPQAPPVPVGSARGPNHKYSPELGVYPGTHWLQVDQRTGVVWFSDTWSSTLGRLDPRTGDIQVVQTGLHGNVDISPDGSSIWRTDERKIKKYDTATVMNTGMPVKEWDLKTVNSTYGNFLSRDGRYFGGGGSAIVWLDTQTDELREIPINARGRGRGDFDADGNIWIGTTKLVTYNPKTGILGEYAVPTPYVHLYSAKPDKNGEVWAGEMQGGRVARFNPRTYQWIEYQLPSLWSYDYNSWIDNSTNPPTYWYGDNFGIIVRIQPLE